MIEERVLSGNFSLPLSRHIFSIHFPFADQQKAESSWCPGTHGFHPREAVEGALATALATAAYFDAWM